MMKPIDKLTEFSEAVNSVARQLNPDKKIDYLVVAIHEDDDNHILLFGTACPVCVMESVASMYLNGDIEHREPFNNDGLKQLKNIINEVILEKAKTDGRKH